MTSARWRTQQPGVFARECFVVIMRMNLPNRLTVLRTILIPFFLFFLLWENLGFIANSPDRLLLIAWGRYLAMGIFVVATLTDWYDGYYARKHNLITNFGRLMDPMADKLLIMAAYVAFVELDYFPAWVVCIILAREFLVTGLRQIALEKGEVIGADRWGKNKTIAQMIAAVATLMAICLRDTMILWGWWGEKTFFRREMEWWMNATIVAMMSVVVFFTVVSGYRYIVNHRHLFKDAAE